MGLIGSAFDVVRFTMVRYGFEKGTDFVSSSVMREGLNGARWAHV
jgi:hypothetical protein